MTVHLSRTVDNAPVRDAEVTVLLRGATYPATARAEGGYSMVAAELATPGAATVVFDVKSGSLRERLQGTLQVNAGSNAREDSNSARQLGWWVLNFSVCVGFLLLMSRRRKRARD